MPDLLPSIYSGLWRDCGAIRDKYNAMGGPGSWLWFPTAAAATNPDGTGKRQNFVNGAIYWHPTHGAHPVTVLYLNKWQAYGFEAGWVGYPKTDEIRHSDGGSHQDFVGASIYWFPSGGIFTITGAIRDKWLSAGAQGGFLGYPVSDQITLPDGVGKMNRFQRGVIYWHPSHGAHPVSGDILTVWSAAGYEQGRFGYPVGDASTNSIGGTFQAFQADDIETPVVPVQQSFSCKDAAIAKGESEGIAAGFQYLCTPWGVKILAANTALTAPAGKASISAQESTLDSIECDVMEPTSISAPYKNGARVGKDVRMCFGEGNVDTGEIYWSKEISFTISNILDQRIYHRVETKITTVGFPSRTFTLTYRVRQDISGWPDDTITEKTTVNTGSGDEVATSLYSVPNTRGKYFVEVVAMGLAVPSLNFDQTFGGLRFAIGRYTCDPYSGTGPGDLCQWTDPIDDHT